MTDSDRVTRHYICDCGYSFYVVPTREDGLVLPTECVLEKRMICGGCAEKNQPDPLRERVNGICEKMLGGMG
jgi:hypothetical protein